MVCLQKDDGSDSMAVQLADETHWNDLVIIIAVVCDLCYTPHDFLLHVLLLTIWLSCLYMYFLSILCSIKYHK
jgi:Sec-independent protein secretion pathway component TatC